MKIKASLGGYNYIDQISVKFEGYHFEFNEYASWLILGVRMMEFPPSMVGPLVYLFDYMKEHKSDLEVRDYTDEMFLGCREMLKYLVLFNKEPVERLDCLKQDGVEAYITTIKNVQIIDNRTGTPFKITITSDEPYIETRAVLYLSRYLTYFRHYNTKSAR